MVAKLLDGKTIAEKIVQQVKHELSLRKQSGLEQPQLAVILVGNDEASKIYVKNKLIACEKVGIACKLLHLVSNISQSKLLNIIHGLNKDPNIHAILVQLPLPVTIDPEIIFGNIDSQKDVDGFNPYNAGLLAHGWPNLQPCTPLGIMKLLKFTNVDLIGKRAVVVGASNIVGKPIALSLLNAGCTVTICNRHTIDLKSLIMQAEILISAVGIPKLIQGNWIKTGSIVIDVGINRVNNKLVGDIDFERAKQRALWITKVPGGVGPMTIACLLENILLIQKQYIDLGK
ncbi:MAG: bifunctional methylenetetrahydrofolate dehydrogenase/methenyltetrahydrofolate cyclohydrolase FolD [Gammaproteobacteria bacterium]